MSSVISVWENNGWVFWSVKSRGGGERSQEVRLLEHRHKLNMGKKKKGPLSTLAFSTELPEWSQCGRKQASPEKAWKMTVWYIRGFMLHSEAMGSV